MGRKEKKREEKTNISAIDESGEGYIDDHSVVQWFKVKTREVIA